MKKRVLALANFGFIAVMSGVSAQLPQPDYSDNALKTAVATLMTIDGAAQDLESKAYALRQEEQRLAQGMMAALLPSQQADLSEAFARAQDVNNEKMTKAVQVMNKRRKDQPKVRQIPNNAFRNASYIPAQPIVQPENKDSNKVSWWDYVGGPAVSRALSQAVTAFKNSQIAADIKKHYLNPVHGAVKKAAQHQATLPSLLDVEFLQEQEVVRHLNKEFDQRARQVLYGVKGK